MQASLLHNNIDGTPRLDWKHEIVPRVKQILTDRRNKGIPTSTLRGIFYILVSLNVLENLQQRYESLSKALVAARRDGMIRDDWIVDESRNIIEVYDAYFDPGQEITYLLERLEKLPEKYIKSIPRWYNQTNYVEVWVEKNAMAGVFSSILTKSRQVRIVPNGGWSSFSFESKNMRRLRYYQAMGKEVYVQYYGDYDPSGVRMVKNLEGALKRMDIHFEQVAIVKEQIEQFGLEELTNPDPAVMAKLEKDPNAENFRLENNGELFQIELDALSALRPDDLKNLLEENVDEYFDEDIYSRIISDPKYSASHIRKLVNKGIKEFTGLSH